MVEPFLPSESALTRIAAFLFARREAMLSAWRTSVNDDPTIHLATGLTRDEFNARIPDLLNILDQRLNQEASASNATELAREHGLHRWHKGYALPELLCELQHFHACLSAEMGNYLTTDPRIPPEVLIRAQDLICVLIHDMINGSASQYYELQKIEATERATNLQQALDEINELARKRGEVLRTTSHDLSGSLSTIQGAAVFLDHPDRTKQERAQMVQMLNQNLGKIRSLLTQLMDLARLEGGQETLVIESFDAAVVIRNLVESLQPLAEERKLMLKGDGAEHLPVEGDPVKLQRIAQNLLLNALQYTKSGMISVSWVGEDGFRWALSIQDTGPGLPTGLVSLLADQLKPTLEKGAVFRKNEPAPPTTNQPPLPQAPVPARSAGEGIGLYVVKRLCDLIGASLDIETRPGVGTLFRIRMLMHPPK